MDGARRMVATNLGPLLRVQGRRQSWLAEHLGVSQALVSLVLDRKRTLSQEHAERVAELLGVPVADIFAPAVPTNGRMTEAVPA